MAGKSKNDDYDDGVTVSFGAKFARSDQFKTVFREGMALVEAAAAYLDGDGRKEARKLRPPHSLAYATESMRLTTRLMQLASWLLIRRAVSEGELTPEQAVEEQRKIKLPVSGDHPARDLSVLPERLRGLIELSVLSMSAMTAAFAWILTRPIVEPVYRAVLIPLLGAFGLLFGLWYAGIGV
jgi:regulator of CtrA degradation